MALQEMAVPESPKLYTKKYQGLLGVDYSHDITEIDPRRTPTGLNIISDEGANPVKRLGWRVIKEPTFANPMSGMGKVLRILTKDGDDENDGEYEMPDLWAIGERGIIYMHHDSTASYSEGYAVNTLYTAGSDTYIENCLAYTFNGDLYCMFSMHDGTLMGLYRLWNSKINQAVFQRMDNYNAYVPETTYGLKPNGIGGTSLYDVNLFSTSMTFSFCSDGSRDFYLYPEDVRNELRNRFILSNSIVVKVLTNGTWIEVPETYYTKNGLDTALGWNYDGTAIETFNVMSPHITFLDGHIPPSYTTQGSDNVKITFTPFDCTFLNEKQDSGGNTAMRGIFKEARVDILSAKTYGIFGYAKPDRVFLAGGKTKNKVYYSQVNDPTYFPDVNYIEVGHDDNNIVAMQRVSDYLAILKDDAVFDTTMYMVKGNYLDKDMYFMVSSTSSTVPAIAPQSHLNLIGEPLFLSSNGIFAITGVYGSEEKTVRNRSRMVDRKLIRENNLENSCAAVWNKYYILCVNSHCYVLDSRNTNREYKFDSNYQYESYYWENIPAVTFATYKNELFFGTEDGKICKFNTDVPNDTKYCDNGREVWTEVDGRYYFSLSDVDEFGEPQAAVIPCEWSTPYDDDGVPQYFKTLNKKGNLVTLLPLAKSSANITLVKDGVKEFSLEKFYINIFSWAKVSFASFSFRSDISARDDFIKKKVKKYKRLQIIVSNDGMFEPFGILGITKTYSIGNFSK